MARQEAQQTIFGELDLSGIPDEHARQGIVLLLNLVEDLKQENHRLRE